VQLREQSRPSQPASPPERTLLRAKLRALRRRALLFQVNGDGVKVSFIVLSCFDTDLIASLQSFGLDFRRLDLLGRLSRGGLRFRLLVCRRLRGAGARGGHLAVELRRVTQFGADRPAVVREDRDRAAVQALQPSYDLLQGYGLILLRSGFGLLTPAREWNAPDSARVLPRVTAWVASTWILSRWIPPRRIGQMLLWSATESQRILFGARLTWQRSPCS